MVHQAKRPGEPTSEPLFRSDLNEILRHERHRTVRFVVFIYWAVSMAYSAMLPFIPNVIPVWGLTALWICTVAVTLLHWMRRVHACFLVAGAGAVMLSVASYALAHQVNFIDIVQTSVLMTIVATLYFEQVYFWWANAAALAIMAYGLGQAIWAHMNAPEMILRLGLNGLLFWLAVSFACWLFLRKSMRLFGQLSAAHSALMIDALTRTFNRLYFNETLQSIEDRGRQSLPTEQLSILMLDLDYFKQINDHYGHIIGDYVLIHFADVIQEHIRRSDVFIRIGGEEFALIVHHDERFDIAAYADRLRGVVEDHPFLLTKSSAAKSLAEAEADVAIPIAVARAADAPICIPLTTSIGGATFRAKEETIHNCVNRADQALYEGKSAGRNRIVIA